MGGFNRRPRDMHARSIDQTNPCWTAGAIPVLLSGLSASVLRIRYNLYAYVKGRWPTQVPQTQDIIICLVIKELVAIIRKSKGNLSAKKLLGPLFIQ